MNNEQIQNKFKKIDDELIEIRKVIDSDRQALVRKIEELEKQLGKQGSE